MTAASYLDGTVLQSGGSLVCELIALPMVTRSSSVV